MNRSESIAHIAPALLAAQRNIGSARKESENTFFRSSYADLGAVMEACKAHLLEQEIVVLQPTGRDEIGEYVETMLLHSSGEFLSDKMPLRPVRKMVSPREDKGEKFEPYLENDPQAQGSAITYARRYGLQSMLFIPAEDDDAEGAMKRHPAPTKKPRGEPEETRHPNRAANPSLDPNDDIVF